MNSSGSLLSPICILAFIAFMVIAFIVAFIYSRKRGRNNMNLAVQMGFTPVPQPDPAWLAQLSTLYGENSHVKASNVAVKTEGTEKITLFDAMTSNPRPTNQTRISINTPPPTYRHRNKTSNMEYRLVSIVSPHLHLPAFMLCKRMPAALGTLGAALDDMIAAGASQQGLQEWSNVTPLFSNRYRIYTKDMAGMEALFNSEILDQIAQTEGFIVRGEGNMLLFTTDDARRGVEMDWAGQNKHIQQAKQFFDWLSH